LTELRATLNVNGARPIRAKIKEIVPEYCCPSGLSKESPAILDTRELFKSASTQN
jgi:hypothetical protein